MNENAIFCSPQFPVIIKYAIICFFVPLVHAMQARNPIHLGYLLGSYNRNYYVFGKLKEFWYFINMKIKIP